MANAIDFTKEATLTLTNKLDPREPIGKVWNTGLNLVATQDPGYGLIEDKSVILPEVLRGAVSVPLYGNKGAHVVLKNTIKIMPKFATGTYYTADKKAVNTKPADWGTGEYYSDADAQTPVEFSEVVEEATLKVTATKPEEIQFYKAQAKEGILTVEEG